jgi:hypothetical protein
MLRHCGCDGTLTFPLSLVITQGGLISKCQSVSTPATTVTFPRKVKVDDE